MPKIRATMRINAPIAQPTTAGTDIEDLPLEAPELAWPGGPMPMLLVDDGFGERLLMIGVLEGVGVTVLEVSVGDGDDGVGGGSDDVEEERGLDGM